MAMAIYSVNEGQARLVVPTPKKPQAPAQPQQLAKYKRGLPTGADMVNAVANLDVLSEILTDPRARDWVVSSSYVYESPFNRTIRKAINPWRDNTPEEIKLRGPNTIFEHRMQFLKKIIAIDPVLKLDNSSPLLVVCCDDSFSGYHGAVLKLLFELGAKQRRDYIKKFLGESLLVADVASIVANYSCLQVINFIPRYAANIHNLPKYLPSVDRNLRVISLLLEYGNPVERRDLDTVRRVLKEHPPSEFREKVLTAMERALSQ